MSVNNWIVPEDRLPKDGEHVLITLKEGADVDGSILPHNTVFHAVFYDSDAWYCYFVPVGYGGGEYTKEVIAWQPLPEAYKGGKQ